MPLQPEKAVVMKTTISYSFFYYPKDSEPDEIDRSIKEDASDPSPQCVVLMLKVCLAAPPP